MCAPNGKKSNERQSKFDILTESSRWFLHRVNLVALKAKVKVKMSHVWHCNVRYTFINLEVFDLSSCIWAAHDCMLTVYKVRKVKLKASRDQ